MVNLGISVAVLIIIAVGFVVADKISEVRDKQSLAQEISRLPVPDSCTESKREFHTNGIGRQPIWNVTYTCNTIGKQAHEFITKGLSERKYRVFEDFSVPDRYSKSIRYSFSGESSEFYVQYDFNDFKNDPDAGWFDSDQKKQLEQSKIRKISLTINKV